MIVNGYEVGLEPTSEEWRVYERVRDFLRAEFVAGWLDGSDFTQDEFQELVWALGDADFSAEEDDFLQCEYDRILEERS